MFFRAPPKQAFLPIFKTAKLTIELVPQTSHYNNVRSAVSKEEWDAIRKATYRRAGNRCEICGGRGPKWPVECHEVWYYHDRRDDPRKIQRLVRMIALCPACHEVKHFGLAEMRGNDDRARKHLAAVNGWDEYTAQKYINRAFYVWWYRSDHEWELDISIIQGERYHRWLAAQRITPA